jgi:hypothetical protein
VPLPVVAARLIAAVVWIVPPAGSTDTVRVVVQELATWSVPPFKFTNGPKP